MAFYTLTVLDANGCEVSKLPDIRSFAAAKSECDACVSDAELIAAGAVKAEVTDDNGVCLFDSFVAPARLSRTAKLARAIKEGNRSGNSPDPSVFQLDDDPTRVTREFSGHYTVDEIRALLVDLEAVQAAYDKLNGK